MKIRFAKILSAVFGLALLPIGGGVFAGPAGLPQQMLPGYVPASPSRGVASFRPRYRAQPVRPMARYPHPVNVPPHYAPVRHAGSWPIPVSYRPIAPRPHPRFLPYGYRRASPRWAGYPPPTGGYGVRPMPRMPRMAYGYPTRPPVNTRGQLRPVQFRAQRPYLPIAPVYYRQPSWATPRRAVLPMPGMAYPQRQSNRYPVPRAVPGQFAGRYQPYSRSSGGHPDFRFRPMPRSVAYQGYPVAGGYPAAPGYSPDYRFRPGPPNPGLARMPVSPYQARQMPDRPIRRGEVLAWHNTAKQFPRPAY